MTAELKTLVKVDEASSDPVFEGVPDMDRFRKDLEAAEIPYLDEQGRRVDFHALRHTLATNLARCGVLPRVAMEFMRHSEMRLTNKTYTDVTCLPMAEAAEMLPQFMQKKGTQKGTHGRAAEGQEPSRSVADQIRAGEQENIDNKGGSLVPSLAVAESRECEMVHPSGVEPETC